MSKKPGAVELPIGIEQIAAMLPHRYPFLLIDRVIAFERAKRVIAFKNVTINEPFFQGHFPGHPVMPGVLIIEAMAQTAGMLVKLSMPREPAQSIVFYLVRVDKARFNRIVVPGDQLKIYVKKIKKRGNLLKFACEAMVDGAKAAEAEISAMMVTSD